MCISMYFNVFLMLHVNSSSLSWSCRLQSIYQTSITHHHTIFFHVRLTKICPIYFVKINNLLTKDIAMLILFINSKGSSMTSKNKMKTKWPTALDSLYTLSKTSYCQIYSNSLTFLCFNKHAVLRAQYMNSMNQQFAILPTHTTQVSQGRHLVSG